MTPRSGFLEQTDRLLTLPEVAQYLRVSNHAIHMQRSRGQEPGTLGIRVGRQVLFDPKVIRSWLERTQRAQTRS